MGSYLNPGTDLFRRALNSEIYVDKTAMIAELNRAINTERCCVCVSRPRRFGKSMAANMIAAYYDHTSVDDDIFNKLSISKIPGGMKERGRYDVIRINMQEFLSNSHDVAGMVKLLEKAVLRDIQKAYPRVDYLMPDRLMFSLADVFSETGRSFVIIIDEWDCIFREFPHDEKAQRMYLDFLRDVLKDKPYVALAYMTGILPIKKYGTHFALNMFTEFSMEHPDRMAPFVGFTEEETKSLCQHYGMDFAECRALYDGYSFPGCPHVYSPKSVVDAMLSHRFGSYWTRTETYEALQVYIDLNEDGLRDAIMKMMGGGRQKIDTGTFQNDMTTFHSADDVMTLLVHLGYLGYDSINEEVFIPNNEVMKEYVNATRQGGEWEIVSSAIRASDTLLAAVFSGNEEKVASGVESAHLETSHIQYNDENALSYTLSLAFYSARRYYNIVREMPAGKGFADLAFLPRPRHMDKPAMLVELKWDKYAQTAISQIHDKQYGEALAPFAGRLILVGISYDRKTRKHSCRIERV